jgi:hypothetical protein
LANCDGGAMNKGLNDNVTISVFRKLASQLASFWSDFIRPTPFDGIFHVGAVEVEIHVREAQPNTKPLGEGN